MKLVFTLPTLFVLTACASSTQPPPPSPTTSQSSSAEVAQSQASSMATQTGAVVTTIADNLEVPWAVAFLPNDEILVTERPGTLARITPSGVTRLNVNNVTEGGEGGLLGIALHPDFTNNNWLYLYITDQVNGAISNRVVRYAYINNELTEPTPILENIPGAQYHDGGALAFGPDEYLYITTGDAGQTNLAQDRDSLAGKILRLQDDGTIPPNNPFGTAVYSWGHRNPQGMAWAPDGTMWATEHGRSGASSGYDELNQIESGQNYGWPTVQGSESTSELLAPALHSGPSTTWAPASAAYLNGSIYFGGLRGEALYQATPQVNGTVNLTEHLKSEYGRIRAATVGPDGYLYITTSNTDGRGNVQPGDDKLLRVDVGRL